MTTVGLITNKVLFTDYKSASRDTCLPYGLERYAPHDISTLSQTAAQLNEMAMKQTLSCG